MKHFALSRSNLMRFFERRELRHFVEDNQINLLHAHDSHAHTLATLLVRNNRPLIIVTRRSSGHFHFGSRTKYLARNIRYIAISNHIRDQLMHGGVSDNSIEVINSMIDLGLFRDVGSKDSHREKRQDRRLILSAGAFDKSKGYKDAIRAIHRLSQKRNDFCYYLYGDGPEKENLSNYVEKHDLGDVISMPGWFDNPAEYLRHSDIFLSPSHREGLNMSIIEAMAAGAAVAASDIPPHRESIDDGKTGLLFPPGDIEAMTDKINVLLDNPDLAENIRRNAKEKADKFDCRAITEKIYNLYCEAVAAIE